MFRHHRPGVVVPRIDRAPKLDGTLSPHEWDGAQAVRLAVFAKSDKPADPPTTIWLAVDDRNLYLAYRCSLYKGQPPKASTAKRDEWIGPDDAVSISIQPVLSKPKAYMFACRSNGGLYDRSEDIWRTGDVDQDPKWNGEWTGKSGLEPGSWTAELAIPLRTLGIAPRGVVPVTLSLMRYCSPKGGGSRRLSWAIQRPQYIHGLQDRPIDFGLALLTFDVAKGKPVNLAAVKDWTGAPILSTELSAHTFDPRDAIIAKANVGMPPQVLKTGLVRLSASVFPILAGEKLGKPVMQESVKLALPEPAIVEIKDLQPGNYRLRFTAAGPGFSRTEEHTLAVRTKRVEPEMQGAVIFDDTDWSKAGALASSSGIEHKATPELLLQTQVKTPVLAFDPTEDETITCMVDFQGKLYVGSCTQPAATDTGSIYWYDPETDVWEESFQVKDQGLATMLATGDHIYVPGYDADDGGWDLGNFYSFDGSKWVEKRTVPNAIHIYGVCYYHDRIYLSADILEPPPVGLRGAVVSSGDGGETWRKEFAGEEQGQDIGYMTVFKDKIVLNAQGDLFTYDGAKWSRVGLGLPVLFVFAFEQVGDKLAVCTQFGLYGFDGERLQASWDSWGPDCSYGRGIAKLGDTWYWAGYGIVGKKPGHGPGGINCPDTKTKTSLRFYSAIVVSPEELVWAKLENSENEKRWERIHYAQSREMLTCAHSFKGRVYIGSHPEGRVLVMPVATSGAAISAAKRIEQPGTYRLWWNAAAPPGTSVSLRVRMASSVEKLEKQPFVGPGETTKNRFTTSGAELKVGEPCYLQYRVTLGTDDPARTPYVKRISLSR